MKKRIWILSILALLVGVYGVDMLAIGRAKYWVAHTTLTLEPQEELLSSISKQKFYYLDQGSTCAAFASQDGQYVLKLFLHKPHTSSWWRPLGVLRKVYRHYRQKCEGVVNAYSLMPQESGLLYYHLAPTHTIHKKATLYDAKGGKITLDLDRAEYYIQRKAIVSSQHLKSLPLDQAQKALDALLDFTEEHYQKGIVMVDLQLESNFGFIDERPIRIDVEHIEQNSKWIQNHRVHLQEQIAHFRGWLADNYPELVDYLNARYPPDTHTT